MVPVDEAGRAAQVLRDQALFQEQAQKVAEDKAHDSEARIAQIRRDEDMAEAMARLEEEEDRRHARTAARRKVTDAKHYRKKRARQLEERARLERAAAASG